MPGNFLYLGLVGLMLPSARIIHCVRDPRDIGLSIFTFRFHGAHGYAHDLADLGWYIGEHDRLMAHWKSRLAEPNPDGKTGRLGRATSTLRSNACSTIWNCLRTPTARASTNPRSRVRTVSRAQVRQPVNARGLGRWVTYASELASLIAELDQPGSLGRWETPNDASAYFAGR